MVDFWRSSKVIEDKRIGSNGQDEAGDCGQYKFIPTKFLLSQDSGDEESECMPMSAAALTRMPRYRLATADE